MELTAGSGQAVEGRSRSSAEVIWPIRAEGYGHVTPTLVPCTGVDIPGGADPVLAATEPPLMAAPVAWSDEEVVAPDGFGEALDSPAHPSADRIADGVLTATRS